MTKRKISKVVTAATLIASFFLIFLETAIQIGIWKKYIFTVSYYFTARVFLFELLFYLKKKKTFKNDGEHMGMRKDGRNHSELF